VREEGTEKIALHILGIIHGPGEAKKIVTLPVEIPTKTRTKYNIRKM
jgi:hypothetical protein